jgi:hypothetical protein
MKKNYIFKFILFVIPVTAMVLISASGGRDGGYSGSPGDSSNTCANCHSGGSFGASILLETEVPNEGYELNTGYGFKVEILNSSGSKHGFQITAEKVSDNSKVGTFTADGTDNQLKNSGAHVTHTATGNTKKVWNFNWKAPATDVGAVKFYVSAIAANGNGSTNGDQVMTKTSGNFNVLGLKKEQQLDFVMYPNPSSDNLNIQLPSSVLSATIDLFDLSGRLLMNSKVTAQNKSINVTDLSTGIYLVKIHSEGKTGTKQFIKK